MANWVVLAKFVLQALLAYYMQVESLLKKVISKSNKITWDFLWSGLNLSFKVYWVGWENISLPTNNGGLGLFKIIVKNRACIIKHGWEVWHKELLCVQLLKAKNKYLRRREFQTQTP